MKHTALTLLLLTACSTAPNHLGNPLTWPGQAVQSAVLNASYNARRAKVATFVAAHQTEILSDAKTNRGPTLTAAFNLANVPNSRRAALSHELATNPHYRNSAKALIVALMVHGD
jgi:hypothetical protein